MPNEKKKKKEKAAYSRPQGERSKETCGKKPLCISTALATGRRSLVSASIRVRTEEKICRLVTGSETFFAKAVPNAPPAGVRLHFIRRGECPTVGLSGFVSSGGGMSLPAGVRLHFIRRRECHSQPVSGFILSDGREPLSPTAEGRDIRCATSVLLRRRRIPENPFRTDRDN